MGFKFSPNPTLFDIYNIPNKCLTLLLSQELHFVIETFLAQYLHTWNGQQHVTPVLELVTKCRLTAFESKCTFIDNCCFIKCSVGLLHPEICLSRVAIKKNKCVYFLVGSIRLYYYWKMDQKVMDYGFSFIIFPACFLSEFDDLILCHLRRVFLGSNLDIQV